MVRRTRLRNPAGPLLMINPSNPFKFRSTKRRTKNAKKKVSNRFTSRTAKLAAKKRWATIKRKLLKKKVGVSSGKSFPKWANPKIKRRRNSMAKSRKRSAAAKRAWAKRRRTLTSNPRRRRRRRTKVANPVRRRRRRRTKVANPVRRRRRRRNAFTRATARKAARKRWSRRRRNAWVDDHAGHVRAGKLHWHRRRTGYTKEKGGRKKFFLSTIGRPHRRYKYPTKTPGTYKFHKWMNPKHFIRMRNPDGIKDIVMPVALGVGGFILSALIMSNVPATIKEKLVIGKDQAGAGGINLGVLIPGVAGFLLAKYGSKSMPAQSKMFYGLGFGLMLASGIGIYNVIAAKTAKDGKQLLPSVGLSGYSLYPMTGYVPSSMTGYVLGGDIEEYAPRSMGEDPSFSKVEVRGELESGSVPMPTERALAYQPMSVKPYGLGLPREERRYNEYSWSGVYDRSVYE